MVKNIIIAVLSILLGGLILLIYMGTPKWTTEIKNEKELISYEKKGNLCDRKAIGEIIRYYIIKEKNSLVKKWIQKQNECMEQKRKSRGL
jgi:arginine exporter protein ArgO